MYADNRRQMLYTTLRGRATEKLKATEPEVVCIKLVLYVRFEQVLTSVRKEQKRGAAPGP